MFVMGGSATAITAKLDSGDVDGVQKYNCNENNRCKRIAIQPLHYLSAPLDLNRN
jgi:hypothetical protein